MLNSSSEQIPSIDTSGSVLSLKIFPAHANFLAIEKRLGPGHFSAKALRTPSSELLLFFSAAFASLRKIFRTRFCPRATSLPMFCIRLREALWHFHAPDLR